MIKWLRQGSLVPLEESSISNEIRQWALSLAMFEGKWNTHTAAVLLVCACLRTFYQRELQCTYANYLHLDFDLFVLIGCKTNDLKGITKETGSLIESASRRCLVSTDISLRIRTYGLNFLICKLDEFEAELTLGVISDEMTSATEMNQLTWYVLKKKYALVFYCTHIDG